MALWCDKFMMQTPVSDVFQKRSEPRTLYHCIYGTIQGDGLEPTCLGEVNGREDRFLFAASHLTKALAFAFSYHEGTEIICNGAITGTEDEFAIIMNSETTINKAFDAKIFAFPDTGFEEAWPGTEARQYVSTQTVPFSKTRIALEIKSADDLMRHGLQIFSTPDTLSEHEIKNFLKEDYEGASNEEWLFHLLKNKGFVWENQRRGINPNTALQNLFDGLSQIPSPSQQPRP